MEEQIFCHNCGNDVSMRVCQECLGYLGEDDTYDGDDPRQDQEFVARCRENWGGRWPG